MRVGVIRRGLSRIAVPLAAFLAISANPLAHAQTPLKLTLDGRVEGPSAPFFVALEKGYFKSEGLDVSIEPSAGGLEPITRVASGAFDIGFGDVNALMRYRDQNSAAPVKVVFVVHNRPNYAIIGRKSRGVGVPSDLTGKRLGAPPAEPATALWPAFAKLNGIDPEKVRVLGVGIPVREPMLAAGEVDAVTGVAYGAPINLRERGVPVDDIVTLLMADYGVAVYGASIFVNARTLAEKPEAVQGFLRAFVAGLKDTLRDPAAAIPAVMRRANGGSAERELERLKIAITDSILTPEVRADGLGGMQPERFEAGVEQLAWATAFKAKPKFADIFDPAFLPQEAERRLE